MKSAIITSACLFLTTALATPAGFSEYPNIQRRAAGDDTYLGRLYINKNCNKTKKDLINQAWSEAGMLARAHNLWVPKKDYQPAMDMYMGTKSVQDPWFFGKSYKKLIQGNIKRQYDLHTGNYPYRTYTYIYCGDKEKSTSRCALKKGFAYEKDEIGHWYGYTNHLITLCDRFFIEKGPLQPILNQGDKGNNTMKEKIDAYKFAQAWTLFHETYHMEDTVGRPAVIDVLDGKCYGAKRVFEIARDNNAELSYINAESYAAAATAILVQKRWNLKTPPRPGACMSGNSCVKALSDDLPPGEEEGAVLTGTNEGWTSPTFDTSKTTEPPESDWERANPPTLDPKLYFGSDYQEDPKIDLTPDKCFSKDQNATFAKDSDLREKIIAFCGGQKGKEVGKDNKLSTNYGILNSKRSILPLFTRSPPTGSLTLSVEWNDNWDCNNHPFLLSQDECETALVKSVLEKCDDGKNDKAGGYKNLYVYLLSVFPSPAPPSTTLIFSVS
ncbi:hypothetical protein K440DRAFT_43812 [Wilcoxina mikolae CBS 423.85]|nr:hypothetical protein K440DRAFT_43812 [Wilcoxina mikolae CBS 423.85]